MIEATKKVVGKVIGSRKGLLILEVGFGRRDVNRDIEFLAMHHPGNTFYGIDKSFFGNRVEKVVGDSKVILDKGNICKGLPKEFPNKFDLIYSSAVFHLLNCKGKALKIISKHLKLNGIFILIDTLNKKKGDKVESYYAPGELDKLVSSHFHIIHKSMTVQHDLGHSHDVTIYICKKKLL